MFLIDYIINLSIFSLLVSTPLVIRSFINHKPIKHVHLWVGIYGGLVAVILVLISIQEQGYTYDTRYAPVILVFAYLGPIAGMITGLFALLARLFSSGHWEPAIIGWTVQMICFSIISYHFKKFTPIKKVYLLFAAYIIIYVVTVPIAFNIFRDNPFFHFQYILFVLLGVILGVLMIESYVKLHRLNNRLSDMYRMVEASESKYRLIAENTSDLIMVMDKEHSLTYFSPSHEVVLGFQCCELEAAKLCSFIHPNDVELFKDTLDRMFKTKESKSIEFRLGHKNGDWIEFESRCVPVKGENDDIEHIVIISRDISERKKAEEILLQSEKLSIVGELAAGVAHEIRNPLTTIKGFVQLYKWENGKDEINELLLSELARIETITSEMLTLGKPQAVQLHRTNLKVLIENTLELLSPQAHLENIQFKFYVEESPFFIIGEKNQLKQVLLNVLKNAIEAMPEGGNIHINLQKVEEGECVLSVRDEGSGIPEELLPRLGEPFYSLKEKGTGLGLMICNKIIKQHHGSITYQSKAQQGTLVEIKLPMAS
ncbi:PAS domain S-box-containing protein [Neobacillus niacini]|uniref:ATP-binding protein n=1 Tax=Neobacillus niacini TaxID=86668 RepID=UPI00286200BF|nr:ATP-binding protein [Neobacillus niacini]MDR7078558.1 PAS domain S-box-containing protein [Neobacillus niacini]